MNGEASRRDWSNYLPSRRVPLAVEYYDWWAATMWSKFPELSGTYLEMMCGGAELSRRAPASADMLIALDVRGDFLEDVARELETPTKQRVTLIRADARRIPLASHSIDGVLIMGGLHHVKPALHSVLCEVRRVLKPGGMMVASEPANDNPVIQSIRRLQYRQSKFQGADEGEDGFTRSELKKTLEDAGFELRSYHRFGFLAYLFFANMHLVPLFRSSKNVRFAKQLITLDELFEKIPIVRTFAWANIFVAAPKERAKRGAG